MSEDYTDTPEYAAFVEECCKQCRCDNPPCAGVLAGGFCDEIRIEDHDDGYRSDEDEE